MSTNWDYRGTPVHDPDAEMSVLGSMLLAPNAIIDVLEAGVEASDFHQDRNKRVFESLLEQWTAGEPSDAVTLTAELRARGHESALADGYLAALAAFVPTARNARRYAEIVHKLALIREFGQVAQQIALDSTERRDASEFLAEAQARLNQVYDRLVGPREPSTGEVLLSVFHEMCEGRPASKKISTGLLTLDAALDGGLERGDSIVLAGHTSQGKSSFGLNIATNVAKSGLGALFLSLEMKHQLLIKRLLAAESGVLPSATSRGLDSEEIQRLKTAVHRTSLAKLEIRYRPGLTMTALRALGEKFRRDWGDSFALLVVDYIGLIQSDRPGERRERELAAITMGLKNLAGKLNVAILALAQFNRAADRREDRTPRLSDLRDSGTIGQDADIVMFLNQNGETASGLATDVIIAKNRNGEPWTKVPLLFLGNLTRFVELSDEY